MKERNSNLELLRIIAMFIIVAHHYVVNSGIVSLYDFNNISFNMIFSQIWGFGGKMAINIFVLISCYFMCTYKLTWLKILKLYLEIKFYSVLIFIIFVLTGYTELNIKNLYKLIFNVANSVEVSFTGSFMAFYILIPFLNRAIKSLSQAMHAKICCVLLILYMGISTFILTNDTWSYIGWYVTLYFVGSFLRLYPNKYTQQIKYALLTLLYSLALLFTSIVVVDYIGSRLGFYDYYYLCNDSHKLLAFICALSLFMLFNNIDIKNSKIINSVAGTTFGVFLIHTRGDAMRKFLWNDLFKNTKYYNSNLFVVHAIVCTILVFVVCVCIDNLRKKYIEKPLFTKLSRIDVLQRECFTEKNE